MKQLRDGGLVDQDGARVRASDAAIRRFGSYVTDVPATPAELLEMWCGKLPSPAPEMLRSLVASGPASAAGLAARLGKQARGGHWNGGIAVLRNNGLIVLDGGRVAAAPEFLADG